MEETTKKAGGKKAESEENNISDVENVEEQNVDFCDI